MLRRPLSSPLVVYALCIGAVLAGATLVSIVTRHGSSPEDELQAQMKKYALEEEKRTGRPNPALNPERASAYAAELIEKSKGDFFSLPPEDRRFLDSVTSGHGASYVRQRSELLKKQRKTKKASGHKPRPEAE